MQEHGNVEVKQKRWHQSADLFLLRNHLLEVEVSDYGARLLRVKSADRSGVLEEIVLGFDTFAGYLDDTAYIGATIGRFANRIAHGSFLLDGKTYNIELPSGTKHALHGGVEGFDRRRWNTELLSDGVRMQLISPDGDMGFPGALDVAVTYRLHKDSLHIGYEAVSDATTILNLTNHAYFNLRGDDRGDILAHQIQIFADTFTPIDNEAIPTGETRSVSGSAFDLRRPTRISERLGAADSQIHAGGRFNHNFILNGQGLRDAAKVYDPMSGRTLVVTTSEPGLQFYTGNVLNYARGRHGFIYVPHSGFCLETQHFPDTPHHRQFPSVVLRVGELFSSRTIYRFGIRYKIKIVHHKPHLACHRKASRGVQMGQRFYSCI